ncbi:MAG: hypothetical protein H0W39_00885 [Sphingomonas sp.]|nr:hypothetical protein [Sphingomonas sp.]
MDSFTSIGEAAAKVVDKWAWWQNALRGEFGPIHSEPQQGYYRVRGRDGQWDAVAIWLDDGGSWLAYRNGQDVRDVESLWTYACRHPIEPAAYDAAMAGKGFDDEPPAPIGHNAAPGDDPFEALRIEYLGEKELAEEFLRSPIKTQADADKSAIWSRRLADIAKKATDHHKVEKQPSLDEGRRVDERWRELKEEPKALSTKLKRHQDEWLNEQDRLERERQRKAREEADRIRQAAEDAEREAQTAVLVDDREAEPRKAEAEKLARQAHEAERAAEARNVSAGRTGARTSLRTFKSAEIIDFDALFASLKDNAEVRDLVKSLADKAAKTGFPLPGTKVLEERRAV